MIYIFVIVILGFNTLYSFFIYFSSNIKLVKNNKYNIEHISRQEDAIIFLEEAISYSLTLILISEILKLLYIKSFQSLIFIGSIIFLKLVLNYFVKKDLNLEKSKKIKYYNSISGGINSTN